MESGLSYPPATTIVEETKMDFERAKNAFKAYEKPAKDLENELRRLHMQIMDDQNSIVSVDITLKKKREELAKIEQDIRNRLPQFEAGMRAVKDEYYKKLSRLEVQQREVSELHAKAKEAWDTARMVQEEAEGRAREIGSVQAAQIRKGPGRPKKKEEAKE